MRGIQAEVLGDGHRPRRPHAGRGRDFTARQTRIASIERVVDRVRADQLRLETSADQAAILLNAGGSKAGVKTGEFAGSPTVERCVRETDPSGSLAASDSQLAGVRR